MADTVCPLCGEAVLTPLLKLHIELEKTLMREMREANPELFTGGGICAQCGEEYKRKHERIRQQAREIRSKTEAVIMPLGKGESADVDGEDDNY
jgi:hypothetical protein